MSSRCTGHCCRAFWLPFTLAELAENHRAYLAGRFPDSNGYGRVIDIELVAPMIYLAYPGSDRPYSCRHHDSVTGDCRIYNIRPAVCRDYPYGNKCNYEGCTYSEEKL